MPRNLEKARVRDERRKGLMRKAREAAAVRGLPTDTLKSVLREDMAGFNMRSWTTRYLPDGSCVVISIEAANDELRRRVGNAAYREWTEGTADEIFSEHMARINPLKCGRIERADYQ